MKGKHDYSTILIWAALAVTVARYVGAFVASDVGEITGWVSDGLTLLMGLSGVGMGFLDVLGLAYVFDGWRRYLPASGAKWSSRFKVLTGFVVALFVTRLAILTPFTVSRISGQGMHETMGGVLSWAWALFVNLAPILLIGGVTFSQSGFVTVGKDETQPKKNASMMQASMPASRFSCKKCEQVFETLPALAAHTRWKHPEPAAAKHNGKAS